MLDAYAAGVNAFIASDAPLPAEYAVTGIEPEPWEPWHSLAIYKVRHILMGVFETKAWRARLVKAFGRGAGRRIVPILPAGPAGDHSHRRRITTARWMSGLEQLLEHAANLNLIGEMDSGSNSWAIGPMSGPPPAEPHAGRRQPPRAWIRPASITRIIWPATPSMWWATPSPACPAFHTSDTTNGWPGASRTPQPITRTCTSSCFNDADPSLYQHQEDVVQRRRARRGHQGQGTATTFTCALGPRTTGRWSVAIRCPGYGLALRYTAGDGGDPWTDILPVYAGGHQRRGACGRHGGLGRPGQQLRDGRRSRQHRLPMPGRDTPPTGRRAGSACRLPGWDGEHEWQGSIPFEDMPRYINPAPGYIVTANNRPVERGLSILHLDGLCPRLSRHARDPRRGEHPQRLRLPTWAASTAERVSHPGDKPTSAALSAELPCSRRSGRCRCIG